MKHVNVIHSCPILHSSLLSLLVHDARLAVDFTIW